MKIGFRNYVNMNRDETFMAEALQIADLAKSRGDIPIGAILVISGKVFSESNTVTSEGNILNHAEVNVIKKAAELGFRNLRNAVLYSTVEPSGMGALVCLEYGIKEIVFGGYHKKGFVSSGVINLERLPIVFRGGVLEKECIGILPSSIKEGIVYEAK